ncbi:uncharacterized protein CANTADRAFT_4197 [Suhomyces tanzawaensis NRRL Y-17324]|uniref:mRNA-capping enzyme subunit beta n=1 Tax=Suhomyces tanzawaensis NRRL Y-17324 TaxID=984487 RepID=A0A1E4SRN2_9ASCO|nr:uncharacterized protein CANTADRAFT_4197 [Suhomyces tanzawaensis NRRL Y-17324]ODV82169.1 hypothetical protein CANTADRAFT_4197 [Suhomyces tanzawaensis NRRL Y-17324]
MNVGSILNKESPPSESEDVVRQPHVESSPTSLVTSARHSIVNILNDDVNRDKAQGFNKPVSPVARASQAAQEAPRPIKRNSIADITNKESSDEDIDISDIKDEEEREQKEQKEQKEEEDALARLKQIKNSTKPTRYETPPVWAQTWIPPNQARHHRDNHNSYPKQELRNTPTPTSATKFSDKRVFDYTSTPSADLECSITGIIPPPSVTRTIAEWIFANFRDIADHNRKYVELELKFGTIMDKLRGKRINLNVTTECVYTNHSDVYFDMQVDEKAFSEISKLFQELEHTYQEELKKPSGKNKPKRKFNTFDSDITDNFFQVSKPGEQPKSVRVSKDNTLTPPRYTGIEKQRILDLFIHNPSSMYDLRLSLALEIPVQDTQVEQLVARSQPNLVRDKKRNTWAHAQTVTRFDLTQVFIPRESKNLAGKKIVSYDKSFEVELEIDTLEVFNAIDKVLQGTDRFRYEELVEIYVNNARVLNNRVTRLAVP